MKMSDYVQLPLIVNEDGDLEYYAPCGDGGCGCQCTSYGGDPEAQDCSAHAINYHDDLVLALENVLSLYPEDMSDDGSGAVKFKRNVVNVINEARELLIKESKDD